MTSGDLSKDQAKRVNEALRPILGYVGKLKSRMEQVGFPINDKLYMAVIAAYDGLHSAATESHLLAAGKGGVKSSRPGASGRPSWIEKTSG